MPNLPFPFQIFETERKASKNAFWHKKCFNCCKCHKLFDSVKSYFYDGADGEIYCKVGQNENRR